MNNTGIIEYMVDWWEGQHIHSKRFKTKNDAEEFLQIIKNNNKYRPNHYENIWKVKPIFEYITKYNQEGKLVYKQGEDGNMEWITYYPNGEMHTRITFDEGKNWMWEYDYNGKLIYHKNGNGKKFTYQ